MGELGIGGNALLCILSGRSLQCQLQARRLNIRRTYTISKSKACFLRRILVASNAIKTIYNETTNLIKLHYLLHSTRPKFDV